jgi:FkbM family methyltransferase
MIRTPSPSQSLQCLAEMLPFEIETVVDIGVQSGTPFLYRSFPRSHHILYEPVCDYFSAIRSRYDSAVSSYEIRECALSGSSGCLKLHLLSSDRSGVVTHSSISENDETLRYGDSLLEIRDIKVTTLDEDLSDLCGHFLIKIDVDGLEDAIIAGGTNLLRRATVVIVEAPIHMISSRINSLESLGLKLYDIVGNAYYHTQLQQVDLVTINREVSGQIIDLSPWRKGPINWMHWCHYDF